MLIALVAGVLAALFLRLFYTSVGQQWPQSYSSVRTALDSFVRRSLFKYLAFRAVPVYLTGVFTAVTTSRLHGEVTSALIVFALLHLFLSNGVALVRLLSQGAMVKRRATLIVFHCLVIAAATLSVLAAGVSYRRWVNLVPHPQELASTLWTGVFAAVAALSAQRFVASSQQTPDQYATARKDVGPSLWAYAGTAASGHDCDPDFVRAILAAEAIQRPAWMRRLEQVKGRVLPQGSYGVAQVWSLRPISDETSIDQLCARLQGYYPERASGGDILTSLLEAQIEKHNSEPAFVQLVVAMLRHIQPFPRAHSKSTAPDQRPTIEVMTADRRGDKWLVRGTASITGGKLLVLLTDATGRSEVTGVAVNATGLRGDWELKIPLTVRTLTVSDEPPSKEGEGVKWSSRAARLDLPT